MGERAIYSLIFYKGGKEFYRTTRLYSPKELKRAESKAKRQGMELKSKMMLTAEQLRKNIAKVKKRAIIA